MAPLILLSIIFLAIIYEINNIATTLTFIVFSKFSNLVSRKGSKIATPALFINISTFPPKISIDLFAAKRHYSAFSKSATIMP